MRTKNYRYSNNTWSEPLPRDLDSEQTLVLCFFDRNWDFQTPLQEVQRIFLKSHIVGCSGSGQIFQSEVEDESFSINVVQFSKTRIKTAIESIQDNGESSAVGKKLATTLCLDPDLTHILIFSDGLVVNGTALVQGLRSGLQNYANLVTISGGLAGDGANFKETNVVLGQHIQTKSVVAIGLYGKKVHVGTGSFGGWDAFGPERIVTSSKNNVLYELDHKPALDLYKEYLGKLASELPSSALLFPLTISDANRVDIVRTILAVDEREKSMTFAGDIPQGSSARLMKANFTNLIKGSELAGKMAANTLDLSNKQTLAIAISCVGRRLVLGERTEDETESLLKALPRNTQMIGFYSYGELSPDSQANCELHNQTMTLTLLQELE